MITQEYLGKICDIKTGKLDVNAESPKGKYPFFTCAENPVKIDFYDYDCECVLIAGNGEFAVNYYKGKFNAYQRTYIVTAKEKIKDDVYLPYLFLILKRAILDLKTQSQGSIIQYLRLPQLETLEIPLPKSDEQKRIAAILDKADRLCRQRRFAQTLSDSFLQSVFIKMFGDPVSNPMSWEKSTLGDLKTDFMYGTSEKCNYLKVGKPVLRIPNILGGEIDLKDLKYTKLPDKEELKLSLKKGDLLFVRTNGNLNYVGRCAVFNLELPYLFASYLIRARLTNKLNPVFVSAFLRTPNGREIMFPLIRTTAGQYNISTEGLKQIEMIIPPLPLQEKFAAIVQKFERVRRQQREATRQAEHLFQTLLHRAFRGEL